MVDTAADVEKHLIADFRRGIVRAVVLIELCGRRTQSRETALWLIRQPRREIDAKALDKAAVDEDVTPRLILRVPSTRRRPLGRVLIIIVRALDIAKYKKKTNR